MENRAVARTTTPPPVTSSADATPEDAAARSSATALPVRDIMSSSVYTVDEERTLADVLDTMHTRRVEQVPVVREGRPVGIVARHDLLKLMLDRIAAAIRQTEASS